MISDEYASAIISCLVKKCQYVSRIDLVWDTYIVDSMKGITTNKNVKRDSVDEW